MAELMDIKAVIPNPDNPRFIRNEDYEKLLYSIQTFPSMTKLRKIIVNDKMIIQGGNMRYRASKELKKKEVYVDIYTQEMYQQDLKARRELAENNGEEYKEESYEQLCKEFVIRDNVEFGQWNYDDLANEWEQDDLQKWGVINPEGWEQEQEAQEDDYQIPDEINTDIVLGDLIEIGEHRLLCGDSTDSDTVAKLMDGEKADIMVSDPPYGIDLDTDYSKMGATTTKYEKIKGDNKEFDLSDVISISGTKEQYIWGGDYFVNSLNWMSGTQIIWAKRHSEEENKVFGSAFESLWVSYKCKKVIFFIRPINQSSERLGVHPTQKPIECMSKCIEMSKLKGSIYDAFLGSGSTMVAAHQLKRKCYGMELDPKYCQVIIDRMQKLDDTLDVKINGKIYEPELMTES